MRGKIFRSMLLLAGLALLLCSGLFLYGSFAHQLHWQETTQRQEKLILFAAAQNDGAEFFRKLEENPPQDMRLFLFDTDGNLLAALGEYDNAEEVYQKARQREAFSSMIQIARDAQSGKTFLIDATTLEGSKLLYSEIPQPDDMTTRIALYLLIAFIIAVAGASLLARRVTRSLTRPFDTARLEDLAVQDVCEELQPLANRMLDQNVQIQKQLQKQHAELKFEYEKQDRTRRDFTANVSHELKTPLTSISGYAEILRDGLVRAEDIERFAGKIYDEAQRMIVLVGDILKLSQLDEGHQALMERVRLDLYVTCERVIARLQSAAEGKRISFTLSGDHCFIVGVEQIIDEIVYNLCDNAIKYNREEGAVSVSVTTERERVVLTVEDTGIGISEEEKSRVFERFYRVDKSHSKEIGGTGLGLSIVKHGAVYHEARIEMDSRLGEGTRFRILFQAAQQTES